MTLFQKKSSYLLNDPHIHKRGVLTVMVTFVRNRTEVQILDKIACIYLETNMNSSFLPNPDIGKQ